MIATEMGKSTSHHKPSCVDTTRENRLIEVEYVVYDADKEEEKTTSTNVVGEINDIFPQRLIDFLVMRKSEAFTQSDRFIHALTQ